MSWGRTDDSKVLDPDIGSLTDTEYRSHDALLQYCLREHRDTGIFHESELRHAIYATPRGPKATTRKHLSRLAELTLVTTRDDYTDEELNALDISWPNRDGHYRIRNWEKFNPPRDLTAAERKRRERANKAKQPRDSHTKVTDESRRDNRDSHGPSHARQRLRPPSRPVLTTSLEAQAPQDQDATDHANEERVVGADHATLDREQLDLTDACHRLLAVLPDAHDGSERILRAIIDDDYAFDQARDECQRVGGKAGLAVTILRRIAAGGPTFDVELRDMGDSSNGSEPARPPLPLFTILTAWIRTVGHTDVWPSVEREIEDRQTRRGDTLTDEERLELHELWQSLQPDDGVEPEPPPPPADGKVPTVDLPGLDDQGRSA